jgi:hypothetical protein
MTRALILMDRNGDYFDRNQFELAEGFGELGIAIQRYKRQELLFNEISITPNDIFCGTIDTCRSAFRRLKIQEPVIDTYPESILNHPSDIMGNIKRNITLRTLHDVINSFDEANPIFMKPVKTKMFEGKVINTKYEMDFYKTGFDLDMMVYVSNVVDIREEYRAFIHNGKIENISHYKGSICNGPSEAYIEQIVEDLDIKSCFYCIDIAVYEDCNKDYYSVPENRKMVLEVNDGWALGNYSMDSVTYAQCIMDRWQEICQNSCKVISA